MNMPVAKPYVQKLSPYVPGRPIKQVQREFGLSQVYKLASNENPFGPSPAAIEAYRDCAQNLWLYPDNDVPDLTAALAAHHQVEVKQIVYGAGSSHVLELVARAYAGVGDEIIYTRHSFLCYPIVTQAVGATGVVVDEQKYTADIDAIVAAITPRTKVIFLANPNNPTGTWVDRAALDKLMANTPANVVVVLDEAYAEYAQAMGVPDATELMAIYPNLVVTRTFSKVYGLATLRVGYGLAHPDVADMLNRTRLAFFISAPAEAAAVAALADTDHQRRVINHNTSELKRLQEAYTELGLLAAPSAANFLLLDFGRDTSELFIELQKNGIIARPTKGQSLPNCLRLSIGLTHENDKALSVITRLVAHEPE